MEAVYSTVLCPLDGSEVSGHGALEAIKLARDQGAQLHFLHVVDNGGVLLHLTASEKIREFARESGRNILERAASEANAARVAAHCALTETSGGRGVADSILEQARQLQADLIVMGIHGRRAGGPLPGADAKAVMADSPVPVLLVK